VIIIYHQNNRITKVISSTNETISVKVKTSIADVMMALANQFPNAKIIWCNQLLENSLNLNEIKTLFHHNKLMLSYGTTKTSFLGDKIGFVEESPFIKINKNCTYPTWLMSSEVGVIHASVLNLMGAKIKADSNFDYFLNSVAKVGMILGLLCYSEPKLLSNNSPANKDHKANLYVLFRFVKQHYKMRWIVLLFFNLFIFEKQLPIFPFVYSLFFKNRKKTGINLDSIPVKSGLAVVDKKSIDVIIPTIGRKKYLYAVLQDLAQQTHLPINVIIVEQNPQPDSVSDLDFLRNHIWPFNIKHTFTHQSGACNARNLALSQVESEWVFLADDDIVFKSNFFEDSFLSIIKYGVSAVSVDCLVENEKSSFHTVVQWLSFGSGCSIVATIELNKCRFSMGYEFGYGEDNDFGMQLRNRGTDILYLPTPSILHLKAPIGGFRTKPILAWENDEIQPKPSPTVMLFQINHKTKQQILGYKTTLFFKYYKYQSIKNPFTYFINFKKQWKSSLHWAYKLKSTE